MRGARGTAISLRSFASVSLERASNPSLARLAFVLE